MKASKRIKNRKYFNFGMEPELHTALKIIATKKNISMGVLANRIIARYIKTYSE